MNIVFDHRTHIETPCLEVVRRLKGVGKHNYLFLKNVLFSAKKQNFNLLKIRNTFSAIVVVETETNVYCPR